MALKRGSIAPAMLRGSTKAPCSNVKQLGSLKQKSAGWSTNLRRAPCTGGSEKNLILGSRLYRPCLHAQHTPPLASPCSCIRQHCITVAVCSFRLHCVGYLQDVSSYKLMSVHICDNGRLMPITDVRDSCCSDTGGAVM